MFGTLYDQVPAPRGLDDRARRLTVLGRVLDGTLYDVLTSEFHDERNGADEYVPLRKRRPSVRYGLCRLVVEDSVSFLFGEGRFPAVECADKTTNAPLTAVLKDARASDVFVEAAMIGSIGSVAVLFRVLKGRVFLTALATAFLTPEWDPEAPDTLLRVTEAYQVQGQALRDAGRDIPDRYLSSWFWHRREWSGDFETWFLPQLVSDASDGKPPRIDTANTIKHGLGFVPLVWIKNLPGGVGPDGGCTFRPAIETSIEIDYQLSQGGRALKYAADPRLMIREPTGVEGGEIIGSADNALIVSEKGDAKLLEISGAASDAVISYVRELRELALESVHGNRANADRLGAAQSGRAMELLYAPLINLADRLRTSYGEGLLAIADMIRRAQQLYLLKRKDGSAVPKMSTAEECTLRWPPYFVPTHQDLQFEATTLGILGRDGHMSKDTAIRRTAASWDVTDFDTERAAIQADEAAADERAKRQGAQIQDREPLPA